MPSPTLYAGTGHARVGRHGDRDGRQDPVVATSQRCRTGRPQRRPVRYRPCSDDHHDRRRRSRRARRAPGRRTAIALFLLPALVLYALFVLFPIVQAVHYSLFKWNGLTPLTDFVGLANYQRALAEPVFQGAVQHNAPDRRPVARRPDPVRARAGADAQPPVPGPRDPAPRLLRPVRHLRGHHRRRVEPAAPAERLADGAAPRGRPGRALPAVAGGSGHRPARPVLRHLVEVLRLPHDPAAGRPAGDPARARGGGGRSTAPRDARRSAT